MMRTFRTSRRGSAYIAVLVTVVSVVVLVLSGSALRRSTLSVSHAHADAIRASHAAEFGARYAEHLVNNPEELVLVTSDSSLLSVSTDVHDIDVTLVDPGTGSGVTPFANRVRVVSVGKAGETKRTMSFEYKGASEYRAAGESLGAESYWPLTETRGSASFEDEISGSSTPFKNSSQAGRETHTDGSEAPWFVSEAQILEVDHDGIYEADEISIAMWVMWDSRGDQVQGVIAKETADASNVPQHSVYFNDGHLVYSVSLFGSTRSAYADRSLFTDDAWHFVVVTVGVDDRLCIYVDGVLQARHNDVWVGLKYGGFVNTFPWTIGGRRDDVSKSGFLDDNLDGSVARILFFPSQITADDVATLFKSSTAPSDFEIVEGSWRSGS